MAQKFHVDIDLDQNELKNATLDKVAADPGTPVQGQIWFNTTSNKAKYYDGTTVYVIASEAYVINAINQLGQCQGIFSAVPGLLPTASDKTQGDLTTIKKGDYWVISAAGTIAGIGGADELSVGDLIQFFGTTPATAADWIGIQRNLNDALVGNVVGEKQTVSLVANTPLNVNAATIVNIHSIQVYDSAGDLIIVDIQKLGGNNQRTLTAKKALTNIVVEMTGTLS